MQKLSLNQLLFSENFILTFYVCRSQSGIGSQSGFQLHQWPSRVSPPVVVIPVSHVMWIIVL